MPIYEFCCHNCGHEFELLQKISDPLPSECPNCDKADVQKLVSATSFRLKGSGWYETDFKNKPKPKTETETKSSAETTAKSSDTTSTGSAASK